MNRHEAERLARRLLLEHGHPEVTFQWTRAVSVAGDYRRATRTIRLSLPIMEASSEQAVRETMLHEIAHHRAPVGAEHGPLWAAECVRLGIAATPCVTFGEGGVEPPRTGWTARCSHCGRISHRTRIPQRRVSCGQCSPRVFSVTHVLTWRHRDGRALTHAYDVPAPVPEGGDHM